jgi:hypothetical protein
MSKLDGNSEIQRALTVSDCTHENEVKKVVLMGGTPSIARLIGSWRVREVFLCCSLHVRSTYCRYVEIFTMTMYYVRYSVHRAKLFY